MYLATQFTALVVAGLGLVGGAAAAPTGPVHNATSLQARGPYDTHNGWVSHFTSVTEWNSLTESNFLIKASWCTHIFNVLWLHC